MYVLFTAISVKVVLKKPYTVNCVRPRGDRLLLIFISTQNYFFETASREHRKVTTAKLLAKFSDHLG